ncbi:MAG: hypothetical protein JWN88_3003 [Frankiales bacterium]|jgi:hypothetical protein|nr:hypothetical protein [Frankiales bacterium]
MSDSQSDPAGETSPTPDPSLAGAGLSATGKTADQFSPGDDAPGATYGGPAGTGTGERESSSADDDADEGADASGDVEGA